MEHDENFGIFWSNLHYEKHMIKNLKKLSQKKLSDKFLCMQEKLGKT